MASYDIVISGGTVVDGTGTPARPADVGIVGDRIVEVADRGSLAGSATRTIDAEGRLVTPGFVDIHSHLDAQVAWDAPCSSSCWHGVTSVVVGNCGVTFAPVRPTDHELLAKLMESVEDIPAGRSCRVSTGTGRPTASTYDDLDTLAQGHQRRWHGRATAPCGCYAMGERCIDRETTPPPKSWRSW